MTSPAAPIFIVDEAGQHWVPVERDSLLGTLSEIELADDEESLSMWRYAQWFKSEQDTARAASNKGFIARMGQWYSASLPHYSSALALGALELSLRDGQLYKHRLLLCLPENTPEALHPPNSKAHHSSQGMARIFSFHPEPLALRSTLDFVPAQGSDFHWYRDQSSQRVCSLPPHSTLARA